MALTGKQEHFAQCVADGMTQSDAYRTAYDVGVDTKAETIWNRAYELMADGEVSARVAELKKRLEDECLWTRRDSVLTLSEIAEKTDLPPAGRVAAVKELNAMHGYNEPQKIDLLNSDGSLKPTALILRAVAKKEDESSE